MKVGKEHLFLAGGAVVSVLSSRGTHESVGSRSHVSDLDCDFFLVIFLFIFLFIFDD
jgi:hypothetical protein